MDTFSKVFKTKSIVFCNGTLYICIPLFFGKHPWHAVHIPFAVRFGHQSVSVLYASHLLSIFLPVSAQALLNSPVDLEVLLIDLCNYALNT